MSGVPYFIRHVGSGGLVGVRAPEPGPPPGPQCPDGWEWDDSKQACAPTLPWPFLPAPPETRTGVDLPLWSPVVSPVTAPLVWKQQIDKASKGARDLFGGGSGGAAPKEPGFDWSGVLKLAAIAGVVVGGFWVYEMFQTQKATNMGVLRGALGGGG